MSDWTPTTADVRGRYARGKMFLDLHRADFDRWLEQVKAEARADALADAGLLARPLPTRDEIAEAIADGWNSVTTLNATAQSIGPSAAADAVLALLKGQDT